MVSETDLAVRNKLISVKMDQLSETVTVFDAVPRVFADKEWKIVGGLLDKMEADVDACVAVLSKSMEITGR
jgi:hypothetical protein